MTLDLDTGTPIRSAAGYRELVAAIADAPASTQETEWLEWKSLADVGKKEWQAELSRQVLGFANRDPEVAAKWCGGCAYVVVGASPKAIDGTPVHDAAKIEAWLTPYVGRAPNAPEWAAAYFEVLGKQVLVVTIEPPQFGHQTWPCRKSYSPDPRLEQDQKLAVRKGAVYVRHKASTEETSDADVDMLSRRAAGNRRRLGGISLLVAAASRATSLDAGGESLSAWADRERSALRPQPPARPKRSPSNVMGDSLTATSRLIEELGKQATLQMWADPRTPDEYQAEVDAYIAKATDVLPSLVAKGAYERNLGAIALSVRNHTDDPIRGLQVEVVIAAKGIMAVSEESDFGKPWLPRRPIMLGKDVRSPFDSLGISKLVMPSLSSYVSPGVRAIGPGVTIDNDNSVRLTFEPLDLYARETAALDEFFLFATIDHAGTTLNAEWTARGRDVSGVVSGVVAIQVDANVPTLDELLTDPEDDEEE